MSLKIVNANFKKFTFKVRYNLALFFLLQFNIFLSPVDANKKLKIEKKLTELCNFCWLPKGKNLIGGESMNEEERKKVKFSLTKFTKNGSFRFTGFGEIDKENLYTKNKIYEDCIRYCHKRFGTENEYKGSFSQFEEIEFANNKNQLVNLEIEVCYGLWFRILN